MYTTLKLIFYSLNKSSNIFDRSIEYWKEVCRRFDRQLCLKHALAKSDANLNKTIATVNAPLHYTNNQNHFIVCFIKFGWELKYTM